MRLAWVELRDFRNHAHTRIDPMHEGLSVAVGPNGEGKTNLLEGMHVLYALGSPRTAVNTPLVREQAEAGYVRGEFVSELGKALVEVEVRRQGASRVQVDRSAVRRRRDLRRRVRSVLAGPFDLPIVIGDPSRRRAFMDEALTSLWPPKDTLSSALDRVVRQRNRLLKESTGVPQDLGAWDEQLVEAGAALMRARAEAVERLAPPAAEEFRHLTGYGLDVRYAPNVEANPAGDDVESTIRDRLAQRRADELQRRTTLVGPHRDDLALAVRDLGARAFASHGETWAAALCLRLGSAAAIAAEIGEPPVLLVDDPFSALDPGRRDALGERLATRAGQVWISVADAADVPASAGHVYDVAAGSVTERESA